jgi:hypothetical protein
MARSTLRRWCLFCRREQEEQRTIVDSERLDLDTQRIRQALLYERKRKDHGTHPFVYSLTLFAFLHPLNPVYSVLLREIGKRPLYARDHRTEVVQPDGVRDQDETGWLFYRNL